MEIRSDNNFCIITPLCPRLEKSFCKSFFKNADFGNKKIALDLSYVSDCTIEFVETIKEFAKYQELGVFNICSDVFALFNFMRIDKAVNIFVSEIDFRENSRQLINREFTIV